MAQMAIRMGMEVIREVPHATIAANPLLWHAIGTPLDHDAKILIFSNFTNVDIMISDINLDGYGKLPLKASQSIVLDVSSDRNDIGKSLTVAKGKRYYVQLIDPLAVATDGSFYLSVCYGEL